MSSPPTAAPAPTSPPAPPANATAPPPATPVTPAAPPPAIPAPSPPAPVNPPPASVPPPAAPSASPPAPSSTPPATPSAPSPSPPSGGAPATPTPPSDTPSPPSRSPPSSGGRSPPAPTHSNPPPKSPSPSKNGGSGVSTSLVVGVAVGGFVLLLLATFVCLCCLRKKRRRQPPPPHYGYPPPPPPQYKEDHYGGAYQSWQQNAPPPPPDHVVKMQPSPPPAYANRPPQAPPPPPPPMMNSSGGSGSNYSGGEILPPPSPGSGLNFSSSKSTFTYEELVRATDGFSDANLLGQGGFGYVHKGVLPNGKEIAVKQLKLGSGQGEREFQAEVEIISRVHHKHLVSLVGYCISGGKRLLVYEFVTNNTLEFHLHGRPTLEWPIRLRIALGAAKGLAYIHEDCHPKIIHRDIKSSNILLDFKFEAKVADFGLAKFTSENNTHVSTRVMGTFGYLAPEYASSGKLTEKSDVFSFGVMLLELITGRRPVDSNQTYMDDSLVDWARPLLMRALEDGNYEELVDARLGKDFNANEIARMIACAAACVRHSARRRPRMSQVVRALEGDVSLEDLNEGVRPGHSRFFGSYSSSDYDSGQYNEDMKKFKKMAFTTNDYTSSQYSAPTSEYGQVASASSSEGQQTQEIERGAMKRTGHSGYSSGYSGPS
ncbi:hypothetical protein ACQ4PT_018620 [Festuca glaucescens]